MKKLIMIAAVAMVALASHAASFNWQAANLYGSDGATKYSGTVELYAIIDGVDTLVDSRETTTGAISKNNTTFSNDALVGGNLYDFYIVMKDGDKTFTSATKTATAQATSTITVNFGNMATATQAADSWVAVPEPTSGLLMLVGLAGLALRRRRA